MKKDNKPLYWFISGVSAFLTLIILGSILTIYLPRIQVKKTNSIEMDWIEKSLKERQVLLKVQNTYSINNLNQTETIYLNSYFYDENILLMPYRALNVDNTFELKQKQIFWTDFKKGHNQNVNNDSIWTEIKDFDFNYDRFSKEQQFMKLNYSKESKLTSKALNVDYFLRDKWNEYKYYYSSFYVENDIIKYIFNPVLMKVKEMNVFSQEYKVFDPKTNELKNFYTYVENPFKVANDFYMRNIGTLNSLIIDPIGNIEGFQCDQDKENDVLFYGLKGIE